MHVKKVHHTKTIYKIIEKPVLVYQVSPLSSQVDAPQSSSASVVKVAKPDGYPAYGDRLTGGVSNREPNDRGNVTESSEPAHSPVRDHYNSNATGVEPEEMREPGELPLGQQNGVSERSLWHHKQAKHEHRRPYTRGLAYHVTGDVVRHVNGAKHGHVGNVWRGQENISVPPVRNGFNGFSRRPNEHGKFAGSDLAGRHVDKNKNPFSTGTAVTIRGYYNNAFPVGHSTPRDSHRSGAGFAVRHQIKSGRSGLGPAGWRGGGGYPAQDVATSPSTAASHNHNRSWPDAPNGMPAAFTSPQMIKHVYSTLNPVVPYDITLQPLK